ncbi:MAG: alpha-L-fucosidase [Anaerolineae bacterium]|jgi:alpha-L-fucosidase
MQYQPTRASLQQHPVPDWFHDAKLGIFIHWGLYSVPGWAPTRGAYDQLIDSEGWAAWFAQNPYAEWYLNSLRIEGSPTQVHHARTYGPDFDYDRFVPLFNEAISAWQPDDWADLFQRAGAGYVVLTTKHHDGFLLWPSQHPNPFKEGYIASRDLAGELARAVRARGLKMGLYYSGGLDWTFERAPIRDIVDLLTTIPQDADYVAYANAHWRELIERYQPAILWNDIGYPAAADLESLFADYYNRFPEGVVNDRFSQYSWAGSRLLKTRPVRAMLSRLLQWAASRMSSFPTGAHHDYRTPEYRAFDQITDYKWEATRGIGYSFGYNQAEGPEHSLSVEELVRSFVDMVSKNGNLLLNVGPMADGSIPDLQRECLLGLGRWLAVNGEAIHGTRPWARAEGATPDGSGVRFTQKGEALYAILLDRPRGEWLTIQSLRAVEGTTISLLGQDETLGWRQDGAHLAISLPGGLPASPAYALKMVPRPR